MGTEVRRAIRQLPRQHGRITKQVVRPQAKRQEVEIDWEEKKSQQSQQLRQILGRVAIRKHEQTSNGRLEALW